MNALKNLNDGFSNSNIKIKLNLHCIERYVGPERKSIFDDFAKYKVGTACSTHCRLLSGTNPSLVSVGH